MPRGAPHFAVKDAECAVSRLLRLPNGVLGCADHNRFRDVVASVRGGSAPPAKFLSKEGAASRRDESAWVAEDGRLVAGVYVRGDVGVGERRRERVDCEEAAGVGVVLAGAEVVEAACRVLVLAGVLEGV